MSRHPDISSDVRRRLDQLESRHADVVAAVGGLVDELGDALLAGKPILLAGNGGASSLCSHFASDLREATPWSSSLIQCLTADTDSLTAIANDWGYEQSIARQVEHIANGLLLLVSTSGESVNCIVAAQAAVRMRRLALVGAQGASLAHHVNRAFELGVEDPRTAQEAMMLALHATADHCSALGP